MPELSTRNVLIAVLAVYALASLAAFVAYWADKRAAQAGRARVRERTLHIYELLGGWPGAFLAQRLLRHKTRDVSFQAVYWLIVLLHAAGWGVAAWMGMRG